MNPTHVTIGIDLGDRKHTACVLSAGGEIVAEEVITSTRECLDRAAPVGCPSIMTSNGGRPRTAANSPNSRRSTNKANPPKGTTGRPLPRKISWRPSSKRRN